MKKQGFADQEMMTDTLSSQKAITGIYNISANECACPNLRQDMMSILTDEHKIQYDLFGEMQKRGWYPTEAAAKTKVNEVRQKYSGSAG